jgi:GNAT superfamily N-acetyltransferase
MARYTIRPADSRDARTITTVHGLVSDAVYSQLLPPAYFIPQGTETRTDDWREAIEFGEPQVQVAIEGDDRIIGFVGYDRSRDPGSKPTVGEIWAIHVLPTHWSTGAGLALWDAAREGLAEEGCTQVTVWLPLGNERALRFHEQAGFKRELNSARTVPVNGFRLEEIRLKRTTA